MNIPFYVTIAAVVLDVVTTLYVLQHGGSEANPLMARLISNLGAIPALVCSHGVIIALLWIVWPGIVPQMQIGVAAVWWAIVAWNVLQIVRQRRAGS